MTDDGEWKVLEVAIGKVMDAQQEVMSGMFGGMRGNRSSSTNSTDSASQGGRRSQIRNGFVTLIDCDIATLHPELPLLKTMFDKFHEECGVVAIYGHPEASKLAYLSLYALQHRGQESCGISTSDGEYSRQIDGARGGHLHPPVLEELPGSLAIGHTRYSTAGDTVDTQCAAVPVQCNKGRIAVAHNGNITNAAELRRDLEARGVHLPGDPAIPK